MKTAPKDIKSLILDKYFYHILFSLVFGSILIMFFLSKRNAKTLNQNTKFTIAKIISNWHHKNNNGFGVDYEYYVKNVRFQKTVNLNVSKGQKFLIAFDSIHPKRSLLLTDYEINDDLIESKEAEWNYKQIPFSIDSIKVTDDIKNKNAFTIFTK